MRQPIFEYGGQGPVMHMALANGFPPETYRPLLDPLTEQYRVVSLPPRALWNPAPPPTTMQTWEDTADDLLTGLMTHNLTDVIGVGHSLGGVATLLAAIKMPGRFRAVILLDPTIFPPHVLWGLRLMKWVGLQGRFPLVQKALRRRAHFEDVDAAFEYWRGKRLFKDWDDETLWLYVQGLTRPDDDGVTLTWSPAWEARYYATVYLDSWRQVPKLDGLLPVLTIRAANSNTFFADSAKRMRRKVPSMTYKEILDAGHLFPQSHPDVTRTLMQEWLATVERTTIAASSID